MSDPAPISVLLVDDSELFRVGLKAFLAASDAAARVRIAGEADSVESAVTECRRLQPDVVLLDIRLPDGSGFDACRRILGILPETKILYLTSLLDGRVVKEAMRSGGHGFLPKEVSPLRLGRAIMDVAAGKYVLDPLATDRLVDMVRTGTQPSEADRFAQLSPQELGVLGLVARGRTNKEIASEMKLSEKTVKNYLSNVFEKLGVSRRSQAAVIYSELSQAGGRPDAGP